MAKAIRFHKQGGPEVLQVDDVPVGDPGPGQVRIRHTAIGVNFVDTYQRSGLYPMQLPAVAGNEGAGVVEAVGPDVTEVAVGDRVAYAMARGSYAEHAVVPAAALVKLPETVTFQQGAAAMLQGMTAHYLTHSTYPLKRGDTCLVHAAAGGAGLMIVQMAKALGARVIGTVSTEAKARIAHENGADETIRYTEQDFEEEVKRLTGGRGVDVVYDSVGKTTFDKSLNCLRPRGLMALFGSSSGPVPPMDPQVLNAKGALFLTRPSLAHHVLTRDELLWRAGDVLSGVESGGLRLRIDHIYALAHVADAHRALEGRTTTGKLLVTI